MIAATSPLGRTISISLLVAITLGAWIFVIAPLAGSLEQKKRANESLEARYERLQQLIIQGAPKLPREQVSARQILIAPSQASAQASLQSLVRSLALAQGVNLRSITADVNGERDEAAISILALAETDFDSLVNFLYRITTHPSHMWVGQLSVQTRDRDRRTAQDITRLDVRLTLSAPWAVPEEG